MNVNFLREQLSAPIRTTINDGIQAITGTDQGLQARIRTTYDAIADGGDEYIAKHAADLAPTLRAIAHDTEQLRVPLMMIGVHATDPRVTTVSTAAGAARLLADDLGKRATATHGVANSIADVANGVGNASAAWDAAITELPRDHHALGSAYHSLSRTIQADDALASRAKL